MRRWTICVALLSLACSKGQSSTRDTMLATPGVVMHPVPPGSGAKITETLHVGPICPANGLWAVCSIVYRLDRTGVVPSLDSNTVSHEPKLTQSGKKIAIGSRAELAIYVYPDKKSREADESRLDKSQFLSADAAQTMDAKRTLIESENLLAILTSRDDHQRERVANALESGPPQPAKR